MFATTPRSLSSRPRRLAAALALLAASLCGASFAAPPEAPPSGFDALVRGLDALPLLADRTAWQDSSYHRADINQDAGNFLRVEPNGDQVLMDADGPGVVWRTWSTGVVGMQMSKECRLRFYFDGEEAPRLDLSMSELFGAAGSRWPFVPPHSVTFESGVGGGEGPCNLCYVPIPFAKHLKVVGRNVMFYNLRAIIPQGLMTSPTESIFVSPYPVGFYCGTPCFARSVRRTIPETPKSS